jgi:methanogenic corrinoid protein MtbC1
MGGLGQRVIATDCWQDVTESGGQGDGVGDSRMFGGADPQRRLAGLVRTLDVEIIPRLVLARRAAPGAVAVDEAGAPVQVSVQEVTAFARVVLDRDVGDVTAHVAGMRARGFSLETIFLEVLGPTARCLGAMWDEDLCDFTEVTVGLWRLQQVVRDLSPAFRSEVDYQEHGRRALLIPAQGEQHTFGLFMVAEFFRRAGWDVWAGPVSAAGEVLSLVRNEWFAVVGISVSCETRLEGLAANIHAIRRASRNRAVGVMVGGPVFVERPELAALVGADASATDGRQAALQAESLLAMLARRA